MKGTLFIVGGGLRKSTDEVFSALIEKAGGRTTKIAFIMTATGEDPDELFSSYQDDMERIGLPRENCVQVPIYSPRQRDHLGRNFLNGDADGLCDFLKDANAVWFSGGNQFFTTHALLRENGEDTLLLSAIRKIYENGGVIGGSSAGAAIMSKIMIGGGNNRGVLAKPVLKGYGSYNPDEEDPCDPLLLDQGLGFFEEGIVDQHFNRRPRLLRLLEACLHDSKSCHSGYAVSEDTAIVYHDGSIQVLGSAGVYIFDCRNAVKTGTGCYQNILMHGLHKGDSYNIKDHTAVLLYPSPERDTAFDGDFLHASLPNDPHFDQELTEKLFYSYKNSLSSSGKTGLPSVQGAYFYRVCNKPVLVAPEYSLLPDSKGYQQQHASFANVQLNIESREIQI